MRLTLTRSVVLTAGLFLAAAPAVAHAQGSSGGGSLPTGSYIQSDSADTAWDAGRFDRTFSQEQIDQCWADVEAAGGITTGIPPCPNQPITDLDLALGRLLFGTMFVLGSSGSSG